VSVRGVGFSGIVGLKENWENLLWVLVIFS